jgi:lipoprotein NlpD
VAGEGRRIRKVGLALIVAAACALAACSDQSIPPARGPAVAAFHIVRRGETLSAIARRYRVSVASLMEANGIRDPRRIQVGTALRVPGAASDDAAFPIATEATGIAPRLSWPINGAVISSRFGMRHGMRHDGVDIAAAPGTPIKAAGSGIVIYTGYLRGYGEVVIIRHSPELVTLYAHDRLNSVHEGQKVAAGQIIGEVGRTGRTTGPNLHFEVRENNVARDPIAYLSPPASLPSSESYLARTGL